MKLFHRLFPSHHRIAVKGVMPCAFLLLLMPNFCGDLSCQGVIRWYHFVMEWQHGVLTVWRNEEQLLSIASDTFAPQDTLRVRLGGSPFDAGVAGVTLRNVIISGIAAS